jgi:aryl-alcohol dehydrogenase-like predicted oxidoreductase
MTVLRRQFGRADWQVSEISFGAWQLGGQWGPVDDEESIRALLTSYEAGVNFVDTAQMYGLGHSETVVGKSLKQWSGEKIYVATKAQPVQWPAVSNEDPLYSELYPKKYLVEQVEASLKRLNVDSIDLYQLHCWAPDGMKNLEWFETLSSLRDQGKIEKIGVSIRDYRPDDGIELAESGMIDSIQVIHNIFEQLPEKNLFPAAQKSGTAIVARVVLDSGSLSGSWKPDTYGNWPEGSVLHTLYRDERFGETLQRVENIKHVTREFYQSLAEAAVRFVLDRPEVSTAILGMSNAKRIHENLSYSDNSKFPLELKERLVQHEWRRNYYQ